MVLSLVFLILAIGCRAIGELQQHGKLKWMDTGFSFWGRQSWYRKYKRANPEGYEYEFQDAPKNWYYKLTGLSYKERFPLSGSLLVWTTDGPHLMQFFFFLFISLSLGIALELSWKGFILVWLLIHLVHFLVYKLLSK